MANYDFTTCLSSLDFELLSKDLLEIELGIQLENFGEGRDRGIDLRYAPVLGYGRNMVDFALPRNLQEPPELIVQCKRYSSFANLKSELKNKELAKIIKLKPARYILTTSVSLSPLQVDELKTLLSPFIHSTGDIYGRERLNSILTKHQDIERRHIKLWITSSGVLDAIINAGTHIVTLEEVERTIAAAKIYVRNSSFDEALGILKNHHVCIISGQPGIGKTTLARMLLLYYYERDFDVVKIESDIAEARAVGYHKKPRFYYYDDFLGQTALADKLNKNEDQKLLDFMAGVRGSKDSVFVLTTREYILNQAKLTYEKLDREKFDHRTCIIDLAKYSRRVRAQILYNHLHFSNLPRPHLESLVAKRGYIQIVDHRNYNPRLIQYLTDSTWLGETPSTEYLALFLRNLDNPVQIWGHAFQNQLSDRARHLLFVLTTMPMESLLSDVEQSFISFHTLQCVGFRIPQAATDFKTAMKELDGTFVATRKIQATVLVSFQNPSIRDFMQNLLLGGELLPEVIDSLVFFEQAQWFVEILNDKPPQVSHRELTRHAPKVLDTLIKLIETNSCSFVVRRDQSPQRVWPQVVNPAERLATAALAIANQGCQDYGAWLCSRISTLATKVEAGNLSPDLFIRPIKVLEKLGWLHSPAGKLLVLALKCRVLTELHDLDDFETLANLISSLPQSFNESELSRIRVSYSEFADEYAAEIDSNDPDEIREKASRMGNVGNLLKVDTDAAEEILEEFARQIENEEESHWDDDDDRGGGGGSDECSESELDSMFGTLGS